LQMNLGLLIVDGLPDAGYRCPFLIMKGST